MHLRSGSGPLAPLAAAALCALGLAVSSGRAALAQDDAQDADGGSVPADADPVGPDLTGQDDAEPVEPTAPPAPPVDDLLGENVASYVIHARVDEQDDGSKFVDGELTLTWENQSGEPVSDLWFHLYWNAFANNRSTHQFEGRGILRGEGPMESGQWGWMHVTGAELLDPAGGAPHDLIPTFRYEHPDEGDWRTDDLTVCAFDLPAPVADGESVEVTIRWESRMPRVRRRTGYKDDFILAAHWFPKLGVYRAGEGWYCHQFHLNTEFFSDYGTYDVTLDLPSKYDGKIGASGAMELERTTGGDRMEVRFVAPPPPARGESERDATGRPRRVHGFTWTADTNFVVRDFTFRWSEWAADYPEAVAEARRAFGEDAVLEGPDVAVRVLIQREREEQAERHFKATAAALFFYGLWFGPYPYPNVTVVDPAWGGGQAAGMEYPQIFTAGTRLFTREEMHAPESVTIHECGHQFWYGLVGNNEPYAPWLDEGLNSYTDSEVLFRVYGPRHSTTSYAGRPLDGVHTAAFPGDEGLQGTLGLRSLGLGDLVTLHPVRDDGGPLSAWMEQPWLTLATRVADPRWSDRVGYLRSAWSDRVDTPSWRFVDSTSYRCNSYARPAVGLRSLPGLLGTFPEVEDGRAAFLRGMRHFSTEWRYKHPDADDFFDSFLVGAGLPPEARVYLEELFQGTATVDWSVEVVHDEALELRGWFPTPDGPFAPPPEEVEEPEPQPDEDDPDAEQAPKVWHTDVVVRRRGDLRLPLPVYLEYADGESELYVWERADQEAGDWRRVETPDLRARYVDHGASGNWIKLRIEGEHELVKAVLDPPTSDLGPKPGLSDRRYFLDEDLSNNEWHAERDTLTPLRWAERVYTQYSHWLFRMGSVAG